MDDMPTFKLCLIGEEGSGKSELMSHYLDSQRENHQSHPTLGTEVNSVIFHFNEGPARCTVWEVAGDPQYAGLREGYFISAEGCLLMDSGNDDADDKWIRSFRRVADRAIVCRLSEVPEGRDPLKHCLYEMILATGRHIDWPLDVEADEQIMEDEPFI